MKLKDNEDSLLLWSYLYDSVSNNDLDGIKNFLLTYSKIKIYEEKEKLRGTVSEEEIEKMIPKSLKESDGNNGRRK